MCSNVLCVGGGRLPLHIAVDRNNPSVEVVRAVIRAYPGESIHVPHPYLFCPYLFCPHLLCPF